MVSPYLSRLRPAESGPGLQPRARSRFEPARTFPVDGPPAGSLGLGLPPATGAEAADVEIELGQDPLSQPPQALPPGQALSGRALSGRALPAAGVRGLTPGRTAVPEHAGPDPEGAPAHAVNVTPPAGRWPAPAVPPAGYQDQPAPPAAARTTVPGPGGPGTATAEAGPEHGHRAPRGGAGDLRPPLAAIAGRGHDQAPGGATRRDLPDQHVFRAGRERPAPPAMARETAPAEHQPRVPDRPADRMSRPAEDPADRIQAMARWLRDVDPAVARPPAGPLQGPPGGMRHGPGPAADTEVTVTIGRIEVRAPAPAPAPSPPPPGGPRRRVPSLDDYLESRTRSRGRPG